jgi:Trypsin
VILGTVDINMQSSEGFRQTFQSTRIHNHPQYNSQNLEFDIAVVILPYPASFNSKQL